MIIINVNANFLYLYETKSSPPIRHYELFGHILIIISLGFFEFENVEIVGKS